MGAGGGANGFQLASGIAGGWPPQTDPRMTIQSGGPRGSPGEDQGDFEPSGTSSRHCELCKRWRASFGPCGNSL